MTAFHRALAGLALLALAPSCAPLGGLPAAPAELADRTRIDEQAALAITLAYTAAARAATLAIETGVVADRNTIARIGALDRRAKAAVDAVERVYRSGNAAGFATALAEARAAVALFLSSTKG